MLKSHLNYPALGLNEFANEFAEYTRSEMRDIGSPEELVSWWCAHPPSLFRDHVLFLISGPVASSSAERFFSFCGQLDADQWALSYNTRRLQFMLQYNGDIEGRFC